MTPETKSRAKLAGAIGLLLVALIAGAMSLRSSTRVGEEGAQSYFYDESERKLYVAPRDSIPPLAGIGGSADDGVRAVVVACQSDRENPAARRIAYLETFSPELKKTLDAVRAARLSGQPYPGKAPKGDSLFVRQNTLVRRESETEWHDMTTSDGKKIVAEWQALSCPDGQPFVVCTPEQN